MTVPTKPAGDAARRLDAQRTRYFNLLLQRAETAAPGPDLMAALDSIERVLEVEQVWVATGYRPASAADMPVRFDPGTGPQVGYVVGQCGHRVAATEWAAGYRVCERCSQGFTR